MIARLLLVLALCAGGADARTTNLRRLDGKAAKVGKSVTTTTSTVAASTTVTGSTTTATSKSSKSVGAKSVKSSKSVTTTTSTAPPGVTLTITPPGLTGDTGVEYSFDFTANNIPPGVDNVIFDWTFSTGAGGTGSVGAAVVGGSASTQQGNTYDRDGTWALIVLLKDASNDEELATETVIVQIGDPIERPPRDLECDVWTAATAGGQGTTIDTWNLLGAIPDDTPIDFAFNAFRIPDRFFVEYPPGTTVLNTGWRGDASFDGPLYPGGVIEQTEFPGRDPGFGEEFDIARRISGQDEVKVTVVGPDPRTEWEYEIRANCNPSSNIASIESDWTADAPKEPIDEREEDIVNIEGAATAEIAEMAVGSKSSKAHSFSMSPSKSGKGSKALSLSMPSKSGKGEAITLDAVVTSEMAAGSKSSKAHSFSMSPSKSGKGSKGSKAYSFSLSMPSKSGKGEAI